MTLYFPKFLSSTTTTQDPNSTPKKAWGKFVYAATGLNAERLATWLPQNEHSKKAASLTQEIQSLEQSLTDKTGQVFKGKVSNTIHAIQEEKQKCVEALTRMNGSYYQDPNSTLKKAWDKLVEAVYAAIGFNVKRADQFDAIFDQLNLDPDALFDQLGIDVDPNDKKAFAKTKIDGFKAIVAKRDARQNQLNQILSTEKAALNFEEDLKLRKELLKQKYQELCGDYFGDWNGQLDQAWRKYQTAIARGLTGEDTLVAYQGLDTYRKQIEAELYDIEQQLSIPASTTRTYEVLTTESITQEIQELKTMQQAEADLSGVDWNGIASNAAKTALVGAGYILLN